MAKLTDKIADYMENNPYVVYGHYDDELPEKLVSVILEKGADSFYESWYDHEFDMQDNIYSYAFDEMRKDVFSHFDIDADNLPDWRVEELEEAIRDNICFDFSDVLKTCLRNASIHIVAIPTYEDGSEIEFPNCDFDDETNMEINARLKEVLGIEDGWKAGTCYSYDILKVCGSIDLEEILEKGMPTHIRLGKLDSDQCVTHNSINGSGGLGSILIEKDVVLPATFHNDKENRYGVDAVFGLVESFWREELNPIWETEEEGL